MFNAKHFVRDLALATLLIAAAALAGHYYGCWKTKWDIETQALLDGNMRFPEGVRDPVWVTKTDRENEQLRTILGQIIGSMKSNSHSRNNWREIEQ